MPIYLRLDKLLTEKEGYRFNITDVEEQMAAMGIKVTRATLSRWISNKIIQIDLDTLDRICEYLGLVEPSEIGELFERKPRGDVIEDSNLGNKTLTPQEKYIPKPTTV